MTDAQDPSSHARLQELQDQLRARAESSLPHGGVEGALAGMIESLQRVDREVAVRIHIGETFDNRFDMANLIRVQSHLDEVATHLEAACRTRLGFYVR